MATTNLLDDIKDNASLLKQLSNKAQEKELDLELVNNCVIAMIGEGQHNSTEENSIFDVIKSILNRLIQTGISVVDAINAWLQENGNSDTYLVDEELDLLVDYYCKSNEIDRARLEEALIEELES